MNPEINRFKNSNEPFNERIYNSQNICWPQSCFKKTYFHMDYCQIEIHDLLRKVQCCTQRSNNPQKKSHWGSSLFVIYIQNMITSRWAKPVRATATEMKWYTLSYPMMVMSQQMTWWHYPTTWCTSQVIMTSQWKLMWRRN